MQFKFLYSLTLLIGLLLFSVEISESAELYGVNNRLPAEVPVRAKVNRYKNNTPTIDNCNCNPGIYTVVYLTSDENKYPLRVDTASMAQKDMRFEPSEIVVQKGSTVQFPNLDPFFHNVFSYSKTKKFDLGKYPQGETSYVTFDKTGLIKVFCEIHSSMRAYVHVLETPYFAVSDKDGKFHIENIKKGNYTMHIWQENLSDYTQEIKIESDSAFIEVNP